jgi:hypothetical protein
MTQSPTALALLLQKEHADFLEEQNTSTQKTHCAQNKVLREMQKVAEGSPGKMEFLSTNLCNLQRKLITEYPMKNTKEAANEKGGYDLGTAALDKSRTSKRAKFQHEHFCSRKKKSNKKGEPSGTLPGNQTPWLTASPTRCSIHLPTFGTNLTL